MTIELGNRLADLRKEHGYSQEELADKLGVSRQAISKWERGEASPDTDNLIELAKIYNMSLDELIGLKASEEKKEKESKSFINININKGNRRDDDDDDDDNDDDSISISKDGVKLSSGDVESVRIGKDGVHLKDKDNNEIHLDDVAINANVDDRKIKANVHVHRDDRHARIMAFASLLTTFGVVITYILLGFLLTLWAQAWVLFLLIPVVPSLVEAILSKRPAHFAYPVFIAFAYLLLCVWILDFSWWHPLWVLFLTIPVYYGACKAFRR